MRSKDLVATFASLGQPQNTWLFSVSIFGWGNARRVSWPGKYGYGKGEGANVTVALKNRDGSYKRNAKGGVAYGSVWAPDENSMSEVDKVCARAISVDAPEVQIGAVGVNRGPRSINYPNTYGVDGDISITFLETEDNIIEDFYYARVAHIFNPLGLKWLPKTFSQDILVKRFAHDGETVVSEKMFSGCFVKKISSVDLSSDGEKYITRTITWAVNGLSIKPR